MKDTIDEKISACLDGELDHFGSKRAVDELLSNEERRQRYLRYQFLGDVLRDDVPVMIDANFAEKVMQGLPDEQVIHATDQVPVSYESVANKKTQFWTKPVAGFAIAASVTAISLVGLNSFRPLGNMENMDNIASAGYSANGSATVSSLTPTAPAPAVVDSVFNTGARTVQVSTQSGSVSVPAVATLQTENTVKPADVILPVSSGVKTLTMEQPFIRNYLATHTEYAAPRGMLSHIRLVGYHSEPAASDR